MKTYEMCFIGKTGQPGGPAMYSFKITKIIETTDPLVPGLVIYEANNEAYKELWLTYNTLTFSMCKVRGLFVGEYLLAETEDDKGFRGFRRTFSPENRLPEEEILRYSIEDRVRLEKRKALEEVKGLTPSVENYIKQLKNAMWTLRGTDRAAFAMYVYQKLIQL